MMEFGDAEANASIRGVVVDPDFLTMGSSSSSVNKNAQQFAGEENEAGRGNHATTAATSLNMEQEKHRYWSLKDFEIGKKIGQGQMGSVFHAREKASQYSVALKSIFKAEVCKRNLIHHLRREIEIQSRLDHPHIVQLLGYFFDEHRIYLILELCWKGSLYDRIKAEKRLSPSEASKYLSQLTSALVYGQARNVIHRDLKPENLLINHKGQLKLADWGSSVHAPSSNRRTFIGTRDYLTPEMIEGREHNKYTDNWGLGVLAYELLVGKPPFDDNSLMGTYQKIANVNLVFPDEKVDPGDTDMVVVPDDAKDFIRRLLKREPLERMSLGNALQHPFLQAH